MRQCGNASEFTGIVVAVFSGTRHPGLTRVGGTLLHRLYGKDLVTRHCRTRLVEILREFNRLDKITIWV
jgi:hypothetical protein